MIAHASLRLMLLGTLASCFANAPEAHATPQPPAPPAKPVASTAAAPQATATSDVESTGKDSRGAEVFSIGRPLLQVIDEVGNDTFTYRSRAKRVFLRDAKIVSVWDTTTGQAVRRIPPRVSRSPLYRVSLAVSDNADWLESRSTNGP